MKLVFHQKAWSDYLYWQKTDAKIMKKLNALIKDAQRMPFEGLGKPEPLRGNLSGWWSRRIDKEHRMIYRQIEGGIEIAQCRYHY
ncbi:MAG: Txe/YoeB family addiction module toxin [Pseudomonadota bacterium]